MGTQPGYLNETNKRVTLYLYNFMFKLKTEKWVSLGRERLSRDWLDIGQLVGDGE